MAIQRPDLFTAYVGTGQIADLQAGEALVYARVLAKARAQRNADAIRELEAVGPPPYDSASELETQRTWAAILAGEPPAAAEIVRQLAFAPRYSLIDVASYLRGVLASSAYFFGSKMDGPAFDVDLTSTATVFEIPVIFIQGSEDDFTPAELARGYLDSLTAPQKAYVSIEGAGHMALIANIDKFLAALNERVRPLAAAD
jgi:pimeloyl-ACP methyl ester carboxylesterase